MASETHILPAKNSDQPFPSQVELENNRKTEFCLLRMFSLLLSSSKVVKIREPPV